MTKWYIEHESYPYATYEQKAELARLTSLTEEQITRWLIRARIKRCHQNEKKAVIKKKASLKNEF